MRWLLMMLFLLTCQGVVAQGPDEHFAAQEWKQALTAYEEQAVHSPTDLQRMGQCAFQQNKPVMALLYWQRAQRHVAFGSYVRLAQLITAAKRAVGIEPAQHPIVSLISAGLCAVPLLLWQLLFLLLWALLLWRARRLYQTIRYGWLTFLIISIAGVGAINMHCYRYRSSSFAVVIEAASLRSGPDVRYAQLRSIAPGNSLWVLESRKARGSITFYKVADDAGQGWVSSKVVGVV